MEHLLNILLLFILTFECRIKTKMQLSVFCFFTLIYASYSTNPSCKGVLNTHDINRDEPRLIKSGVNAKHFLVGSGYDQINIVHVYGNTPYEMGYAMGKLMAEELNNVVTEYFAYLETHVEQIIKILPPVDFRFDQSARFVLFLSIVCRGLDC